MEFISTLIKTGPAETRVAGLFPPALLGYYWQVETTEVDSVKSSQSQASISVNDIVSRKL